MTSAFTERDLAAGPLFDNDAEVSELLDGGLNVAADFGAVCGCGKGGLGDGDDASVAPCRGRDGDDGLGEVCGVQLEFLAAGGLRAEHGSLAYGAGVGVGDGDAENDDIRTDGEEGIGPGGRLMDIDIEALGGQRNEVKLGSLLVALSGRGLYLVLGVDGGLSDAYDGLLFLVASDNGDGQEKGEGEKALDSRRFNHMKRITGAPGGCGVVTARGAGCVVICARSVGGGE